MAEENFQNLLDIYQMMRPVSVAAAERVSTDSTTANFWKTFFETLTTTNAAGVATLKQINKNFGDIIKSNKVDSNTELLKEAKYAVRIYSENSNEMNWVPFDKNPANIYGEEAWITSLKECYSSTNERQNFGVILCCSPMLTPATRNTDKVEMWLNYIPSIVLSRCVPYLDIKFETLRTPSKQANRPEALNLLKFLEGAATLEGAADKEMLTASTQSKVIDGQPVDIATAGVEMFLTPQTLVNTQPQSFEKRYVNAIDKFRPFASLQSLDLTIQPEIGFMTYKNGTLSFILHDRSRLHEISDLIRPQLYHGVTLWITYGWRHPDEPNNPYAKFINNNMLMREAFKIVNIDMSFDEVGQANIKLKIATSGAKEIEIADAAASDYKTTLDKFVELRNDIKKLRRVLNLEGIEGVTNEVRAYQMLDAVESGTFVKFDEAGMKKSIQELYDGIVKKKSTSTSGDSSDPLTSELKSLADELKKRMSGYFLDKDENTKQTINQQLEATSRKRAQELLKDVIDKPDPFIPNEFKYNSDEWPVRVTKALHTFELLKILNSVKKDKIVTNNILKSPTGTIPTAQAGVVSLGKLLTTFGKNVTKTLNDVSEVQFIFYQLNDNCGPASGLNIAEFPIDYANFIARYSEFLFNKRSDKITLKEFFALLDATQVKDVRALAYGLSSYYKDFELKNPEPVAKNNKELTDAIKDREAKYGTFQMPHLQMFVETIHVNSKTTKAGDVDLMKLFNSLNGATDASQFTKVLRIHVYDKTLNPYQAESMLLRPSETSTHLTEINAKNPGGLYQLQKLITQLNRLEQVSTNGSPESTTRLRNKITDLLSNSTDFQRNENGPPGGAMTVADRQAIKDYVSRNVPTIIYGANGTTVKSATLSTKSDGLVETTNMIKSLSQANTMEANGSGKFGLPLRVIPASLSMTSAGCPLASPAQVFFIDFNTGTTLDNHYTLTHLTHVISKGKFETSWTFGFADGYARFEGAPSIYSAGFATHGKAIKRD